MPNLYPEQLTKTLKQQALPPVLLIFGEEPLLRQDSLVSLRQHLKQQFGDEQIERQRWIQDNDFDWQQLNASGQSMNLFSSFTVIELELPENKPGREGSEALAAYCDNLPQDQLLVVIGGRLKKEQQNSRWFKALSQRGWLVRTPTPDRTRLPGFIHQRAQSYGLSLETDAIELLATWFEGSLAAMDQELQKWALLSPDKTAGNTTPTTMTLADVRQYMQDVSHFDAFSLQESLLQSDFSQAAHRLQRLFEEDVDLHQLLWVFQREVQALSQLQIAQRMQLETGSIFRQQMIWSSQQRQYLQRAQQLSETSLEQARSLLQRLEMALKDESGEQPEVLFLHCLSLICVGPHVPAITQQLALMAS